MNVSRKYERQESLYEFPYHYLPCFDKVGVLRSFRHLSWGLDYMTYMTFACDLIRQRRPASLLDVGCGDGRFIHMVKSYVPYSLGIDLSQRAVLFAQAFNPESDFLCGDIAMLTEEYACITLLEVLEHIPETDIPAFVEHLARLLEDGGRLVISVPTTNAPLNKKHYRHYDLSLLAASIEGCYEIEDYWWLSRRGILERCIRLLIQNRLYILNYGPLLAILWRLYKNLIYHADATSGNHLICVAKRRW